MRWGEHYEAEFPARYWFLLDMEPTTLAIVVARNTLLLATFAVTLWQVWRLPTAAGGTTMPAAQTGTFTAR